MQYECMQYECMPYECVPARFDVRIDPPPVLDAASAPPAVSSVAPSLP